MLGKVSRSYLSLVHLHPQKKDSPTFEAIQKKPFSEINAEFRSDSNLNRISNPEYLSAQIRSLKNQLDDTSAIVNLKRLAPLATYLTCAGRFNEAIVTYEKILNGVYGLQLDLRIGFANCLLQAGELTKAKAEIAAIQNLAVNDTEAQLQVLKLKSKLLFFQGDWCRAYTSLKEGIVDFEACLEDQRTLFEFRRRYLDLFEFKGLILLDMCSSDSEELNELNVVQELLGLRSEFDSFIGTLSLSAYQNRLRNMRKLIYHEFTARGGIDEEAPTVPGPNLSP